MPAGTIVSSGSLVSPGGQQGIPGPNAVSTDAGNAASWGSDGRLYVQTLTLGGRLLYVSATALSFAPFNGNYIRINGLFYPIPASGIAGLANTGCYINGVAGQNLAASTLYRVYCFNNAGTLTADFSTIAHATSTTAGNIGTEIKSGDDTRTFIGLIYTNASNQFADAPTTRYVRSWVNRARTSLYWEYSNVSFSLPVTSTWYPGTGVTLLAFADEHTLFSTSCSTQHSVAGATNVLGMNVDGTIYAASYAKIGVTGAWYGMSQGCAVALSEALHTLTLQFQSFNTGTGQFITQTGVLIG